MSHPLNPRTLIGVQISAALSRHRHAVDPSAAIAEVLTIAAGDDGILAEECGLWAGYFEADSPTLAAALVEQIDGAEAWVTLGRRRRGQAPHGTGPVASWAALNP